MSFTPPASGGSYEQQKDGALKQVAKPAETLAPKTPEPAPRKAGAAKKEA